MSKAGSCLPHPCPATSWRKGCHFFFDEVLALRVERDGSGNPVHTLQCKPDGVWQAKTVWPAGNVGSSGFGCDYSEDWG